MTQLTTTSVLEAIKDIQQHKIDAKKVPVFASNRDLLEHLGTVPVVVLTALINSGKIRKRDSMHCYYFEVL